MTDFSVQYGVVDEARQYMIQQTNAIATAIEDLHTKVKVVLSELDGETAGAYDAKHREWLAKVEDMRTTLTAGHLVLGDIHAGYKTTDTREGNRWMSLRA
ncbi:WXG100 family type VII secretion target [Streptomyces celluloflavus]|uniref:WXG100 family type VII secretion target n=2 Tax=Streptomyces TaxID=1883 RepID=A0A4Q9HPX9_STRKA|nr:MULTISPECIES: WXG100 family type VII secretion target [Streptomyces]MYU51386.1 WXG100 family type VII secretion target [Streptomyces sp. SID7805]TBO56745.1 WXG100 family type VII secretion target [Streptomyces kasugaensis]WSK16370.1 WXG100 family type VII secretion target [Streptomyces celluloflavus]